jgi:hypothetical protein
MREDQSIGPGSVGLWKVVRDSACLTATEKRNRSPGCGFDSRNCMGSSRRWIQRLEQINREVRERICHGNFSGGYSSNSPQWTSGSGVPCGSCHDDGSTPQDLSGKHDKHVRDKNVECYECHSTVVNASGSIIGRSLHVDGIPQVSFSSGNGTYSNGSCSNTGCHGTKNW